MYNIINEMESRDILSQRRWDVMDMLLNELLADILNIAESISEDGNSTRVNRCY